MKTKIIQYLIAIIKLLSINYIFCFLGKIEEFKI